MDTSVVIRLLVGDPLDLAEIALEKIRILNESGCYLWVSDLVVSEAYFALQHHYKISKLEALKALRVFLEAGTILSSGHAAVVLAKGNLASSKPGFVDLLIHSAAIEAQSQLLTCEKSAGKLADVVVLSVK
ncbi:PIN domain-containing protein [Luteolibacter sp.]|uniref:type II toxin-antitoxin system VapC family toxin n=1 Tax=Luteolibacter sp. TaxID=1962973 RepID=UPI003266CDE2